MSVYRVKLYGEFRGPFAEEEILEMYHQGRINLATPFQRIDNDKLVDLEELLPLMKVVAGPVRWIDITYDHHQLLWTAAGALV